MPLSFPPLEKVIVDGEARWTATCRTCGAQVCTPIAVKAAADYSRRVHGPEKLCKRGAA